MEVVLTLFFHFCRFPAKAVCFLSLMIGSINSYSQAQEPGPDTLLVFPLADAFVRNGTNAATNYGFDTALQVKGTTAAGTARNAYLKFSLHKINSLATATLRLYGRNIENAKSVLVSVLGLDSDTWAESGITWNNAPASDPLTIGTFTVSNEASFYEIDITSFAQEQLAKDKMLSLMIRDTTNQNSLLLFNSRGQLLFGPELVITTSSVVTPSNTQLFVENLDGFPSHEDFIASRIQTPWSRNKIVYNANHDTLRMRLHNKGLTPLVISDFALTNKAAWEIASLNGAAYDPALALPLTIDPGQFAEMQVTFIAFDSALIRVKLHLDELTIVSNDDKQPYKNLYLRGLWQREGEGTKEPTAQEMLNVFGFRTRTGFGSTDPDRGANDKPKGDEVLTSYFVRADTTQPVTLRQMGAYHGCCTVQPDSISWYNKGNTTTIFAANHLAEDAQRLLPRSSRNAVYTPAEAVFYPAGAFGFKVGTYDWSDTLLTPNRKIGIRAWKAIDARGLVIPDAYIIANDYLGTSSTNFDYNDNLYFVTNLRPELGPAAASVLAATPSAVDFGEQLLQSSNRVTLNLKSGGQIYAGGAQDPALTIAAVVITGDNKTEFAVAMPEKTSLNAEEATTLSLTFQPRSEGLKIADLLIYYNNAAAPLRVPLYGIGKESKTDVLVPYRIKSGAASELVVSGKTWIADLPFALDIPSPFFNTQLMKIKATDDHALYLGAQSSDGDRKPFRYQIPLPDGDYWVRLHFAETYWGTPAAGLNGGAGSRVMSVELEGELKLINLDVTQEVGTASAVVKNIPVTVSDGKLNINFSASSNRPMICAVEVYQFKTAMVTSTPDLPQPGNSVKIKVYPNPLHHQLTINYPGGYSGTINLQLVDIMGRIYNLDRTQARPGGSSIEMNVSKLGLAPGVYFLRLSANNKTESIKLLVQ